MHRFWKKVRKTDGCWFWEASKIPQGYGRFRFLGATHYAHRVSWHLKHGSWPEKEIDHICGSRDCVNPEHLRECSHAENTRNRKPRKDSRTGFKGVYEVQRRGQSRWEGRIRIGGKTKYLGTFSQPEGAARAYDAAARTYFGDFAHLNFPEEA